MSMIKYVMVAAYCHKAKLGPEISNYMLDHSLKPSGIFYHLWGIYGVTLITERFVQLGAWKDGMFELPCSKVCLP